MTEVRRCPRCLLPETVGNIHFDANGVCNHCLDYDRGFSNWEEIKDRKAKEFQDILNQAKKLNRPYDCFVPLSGGKDSTYTLYLATKVYGLRTLAVTLDNGYLSRLAKENIKNALEHCDADHFFYNINKKNSSALFKEFVLKSGNFCNACMRGINYAIEISAKSFKIPLIIKGSGRRVPYISQLKGISTLNTPSYYLNILKNSKLLNQFKHMARFKTSLEFQKTMGGICDILNIPRISLMKYVPQHIGMYDYIYLPYTEILDVIKREMGWSDFGGTVEHLDCDLHDVPFHKNTLKVPNITKSTFHNSGLIRQGILTKEEALNIEAKDSADSSIPKDLASFLQETGITYDEYVNYVKSSDNKRFENRFEKLARDIYHRLRKF